MFKFNTPKMVKLWLNIPSKTSCVFGYGRPTIIVMIITATFITWMNVLNFTVHEVYGTC